MLKKLVSTFLSFLMIWFSTIAIFAKPITLNPTPTITLGELVNKPYVELLEIAVTLNFSTTEITNFKKTLEAQKDTQK